jgi:predicted SAM-dependent methyltransferase
MKRLNLGCGNRVLKGYVNLDIEKRDGVDVVHNLDVYPYPFKDNEFDEILADNVLEHLNDTIGVMKELHRILKKGGRLTIRVPYYLHPNAWIDPTHKKCLTEDTFRYFVKEEFQGKMHNPTGEGSKFTKMDYKFVPTWLGKMVYPFIRYLRHFCTILVREIEVVLVK